MRAFDRFHPTVIFAYFITVMVIAMFAFNPVMIMISFVSGLISSLVFCRDGRGAFYIGTACVFLLTSAANPVFSHNGVTVLLVVNDNPVTLEAILYGISMGTLIAAVLMMMRVFTTVMTSDRLMCIMGTASPKFALMLSMTFRFIPLFGRQAKKTEMTQKALGAYRDDTVTGAIGMKLKIFSMLATWGLENGIVTADSMSARGYGTGRRSSYSIFRFKRSDAAALAIMGIIALCIIAGIATDSVSFSFYPRMSPVAHTPAAIICYILFGILTMLPVAVEAGERIKWSYLESKI